jgi:predicted ATPase
MSGTDVESEATLTYGNHHAGVCARAFGARALAAVGRCREAREAARESVMRARGFDHPFSLALALVFASATHQVLHEPEPVATYATEAETMGVTHGFTLLLAWARALKGWAMCTSEAAAEAVEVVTDAVASARDTGSGQFRTLLLCLLAETHLAAGQTAAGLAAVDAAFEVLETTGERFHEAELHRVRGELLARSSAASPGQICEAFERGTTIARAQGADLLALRNLIAWSHHTRGRRARAQALAQVRELMPLVVDMPSWDRNAAAEVSMLQSGFHGR